MRYYSIATNGALEGDGCLGCSYKNLGNDAVKKLWNLAFCEVRTGVENSYKRTGAWFPLLGNNKYKFEYLGKVLFLAIHASIMFLSSCHIRLLSQLLTCVLTIIIQLVHLY